MQCGAGMRVKIYQQNFSEAGKRASQIDGSGCFFLLLLSGWLWQELWLPCALLTFLCDIELCPL